MTLARLVIDHGLKYEGTDFLPWEAVTHLDFGRLAIPRAGSSSIRDLAIFWIFCRHAFSTAFLWLNAIWL